MRIRRLETHIRQLPRVGRVRALIRPGVPEPGTLTGHPCADGLSHFLGNSLLAAQTEL